MGELVFLHMKYEGSGILMNQTNYSYLAAMIPTLSFNL